MRLVAMPSVIRPFPEDAPDTLVAHMLQLGEGVLHVFTGTLEGWAYKEKLNCLARKALALPHLITQVQWWPPSGPKRVLDHFHVLGDFDVGKGHGAKFNVGAGNFKTKRGRAS